MPSSLVNGISNHFLSIQFVIKKTSKAKIPGRFLATGEENGGNSLENRPSASNIPGLHIFKRAGAPAAKSSGYVIALHLSSKMDLLRWTLKVDRNQADGRVVIDDKSKTRTEIDYILRMDDNIRERDRDINDRRAAYQWDELPTTTALTDEQAMLCPAVIGCHDLRSKKRYTVSIDNLQPVKWDEDAMDHLVLDTKKKDMLKGLVRYHSNRNRRNERGDLIAGKGQSLVILLHGPPGVSFSFLK